jgi:two-component system LytT family response regulator
VRQKTLMNCLIVDDEKIFRTIIKRLLGLDSTMVLVGECENAIEAHQKIQELQIDLIFLDIQMPGMDGLELARILVDKHPLVIFTTSMAEHAVEAFDLKVVDFLLKPIAPARFLRALEKAKEFATPHSVVAEDQFIEFAFIRDSNVVRRIKINDILFMESTGDYVKIYLTNRDYSIHSSLKTIAQKLPPHIFLRVHRSFIVNLGKVDSAEGKTLVINKHLIPVSDTYRANLNKNMQFL